MEIEKRDFTQRKIQVRISHWDVFEYFISKVVVSVDIEPNKIFVCLHFEKSICNKEAGGA